MNYTYLKDFTKTEVNDIETVQSVIKGAGAIVDVKLFPVIEEAEKGDYAAMAELYEMFTYGLNGLTPNFEIAKRYWKRLQDRNLQSDDPIVISEGLNNYAFMLTKFEVAVEEPKAYLRAFKYMVANLEPENWNKDIFETVSSALDYFQTDFLETL